MEIRYETRMKRFCDGNTELLRVVVSYPQTGENDTFDGFYGQIAERSMAFGETKLYPFLLAQYNALSEHDRKFRSHKRIYSVACEARVAEGAEGERIDVTVTAAFLKKTECEYRHREEQCWEITEKGALLIPKTKRKT